jgi:hypothetical protein
MKEGLLFYEVSAKDNVNIDLMFYGAIAHIRYFEEFEEKEKLIQELSNYFIFKIY